MSPNPTIIRNASSWIEGEAETQLKRVSQLEGMDAVVGMPDLHPGKGSPVGAAFFSRTHIFPYLVGNDIGCGMGLWATDVKLRSVKLDKWERRLRTGCIEGAWEGDSNEWLARRRVESAGYEKSLGTIGGGNHFAEILRVAEINQPERLARAGVDEKNAVLLVHSGSRGYGEEILRGHVDAFRDRGLPADSGPARTYLRRHDHAVAWARANRALIAERVSDALSFSASAVVDLVHNSVEKEDFAGEQGWLHRKGAAPARGLLVPIPGSRGTSTYLVAPEGDGVSNGHSLAHGAGRKWKRSEAKGRLSKKYGPADLTRTKLGSRVICDDKNLLYEEAPPAYKSIEDTVSALVNAGVATIVARLEPLLTYKTSR